MNKLNKDKLNALMMESLKLKYPNIPESYIPKTDWKDNSANALTKCVIAWVQFMGGQAERISSQGQYREGAKIQVGSGQLAYTKQMPGKWTPGQSTKGMSYEMGTHARRLVESFRRWKRRRAYHKQLQRRKRAKSRNSSSTANDLRLGKH